MSSFGKPIKAVFYFMDSENNEREFALIVEDINSVELGTPCDFSNTKNISADFHTVRIEKLDF